jgi:hypothetical protein
VVSFTVGFAVQAVVVAEAAGLEESKAYGAGKAVDVAAVPPELAEAFLRSRTGMEIAVPEPEITTRCRRTTLVAEPVRQATSVAAAAGTRPTEVAP